MIAHLVLMNLHNAADAPAVSSQVHSLADKVAGLRRVEGGASLISSGRSWDVGFLMLFDSTEAIETYQSHPEHIRVADSIRGRLRDMGTCDFDLIDLPDAELR